MSKFNSLQERFDHLRNNIGFPVTLWEEFIQDCLAENKALKDENLKLKGFVSKTAEPALILATHDYPASFGPRSNLKELEQLKAKLNF